MQAKKNTKKTERKKERKKPNKTQPQHAAFLAAYVRVCLKPDEFPQGEGRK